MSRELFVKRYGELWSTGVWAGPWSKAVGDLTAAQAAWRPAADRHSIWQIAQHVMFWRDFQLARIKDPGVPMPPEPVLQTQWSQPDSPTEADWQDMRGRLERSHAAMLAAAGDPSTSLEHVLPVLAHDAYHLGQVMYVRALQGLPPVE